MSSLVKLAGVAVLSAGVTLGAMVYWNGTQTIETAINTIEDQENKLQTYDAQQQKLIDRINDLRGLRDDLQSQINQLLNDGGANQEMIDQLQRELEDTNAQLNSLEEQLEEANSSGETMAERILALEGEVKKANEEVERLQQTLDDNNSSDYQPLTEEELNDLLTDSVEEEVIEEVKDDRLTYKLGSAASFPIDGIRFETDGANQIKVTNQSNVDVQLSGIPGESERTLFRGNFRILNGGIEYVQIVKSGTTYKVFITQ